MNKYILVKEIINSDNYLFQKNCQSLNHQKAKQSISVVECMQMRSTTPTTSHKLQYLYFPTQGMLCEEASGEALVKCWIYDPL